ncbi:MAG: SGNH/GDSL hydrolase family protein [Planctomycetales bacterium]|nr:SGNH/GDSL hydrolase family protein [Planctomycetales bacterium]
MKRELPAGTLWAFRLIAFGLPLLIGGLITIVVMIKFRFLVRDDDGNMALQRPIYLQEPDHEVSGHQYLYDSALGWRNIPGYNASTRGRELKINARGLRDRDYDLEKPVGHGRLLVLGDSFTWGYGVDNRAIYTEVLEERLQDRQPPWEVINCGVSGWGTDQQYLFLKAEGFRYQPDVVLVALFLINDPHENTSSHVYGMHKPVFLNTQLELGNTPVPKPGEPVVVRSSVEPVAMTTSILAAMERECRDRSIRLGVMKFGRFLRPEDPELLKDEQRLEAWIAERPDLHYLDLDDSFRDRSITREELVEGNYDGHWNARGHALVAEILQEFLADRELLAPALPAPLD